MAGVVTDDTGARLQDATVTITHALNGRVVTVNTGSEGEYRAVALLPGDYDITAARKRLLAPSPAASRCRSAPTPR